MAARNTRVIARGLPPRVGVEPGPLPMRARLFIPHTPRECTDLGCQAWRSRSPATQQSGLKWHLCTEAVGTQRDSARSERHHLAQPEYLGNGGSACQDVGT